MNDIFWNFFLQENSKSFFRFGVWYDRSRKWRKRRRNEQVNHWKCNTRTCLYRFCRSKEMFDMFLQKHMIHFYKPNFSIAQTVRVLTVRRSLRPTWFLVFNKNHPEFQSTLTRPDQLFRLVARDCSGLGLV